MERVCVAGEGEREYVFVGCMSDFCCANRCDAFFRNLVERASFLFLGDFGLTSCGILVSYWSERFENSFGCIISKYQFLRERSDV